MRYANNVEKSNAMCINLVKLKTRIDSVPFVRNNLILLESISKPTNWSLAKIAIFVRNGSVSCLMKIIKLRKTKVMMNKFRISLSSHCLKKCGIRTTTPWGNLLVCWHLISIKDKYSNVWMQSINSYLIQGMIKK